MNVFVAVADAGSFSKAAEKLRLSAPAVTRAVASLEDRLRIRLFNRSTRQVKLTEAGASYLENCRRILADIEAADNLASGARQIPRGHLRVTTSITFGRLCLTPIVQSYLATHPQVTASVYCYDRYVSLLDEGMDIAVRLGELDDSSMIARRVGEVRRMLIASPDYIAKHGAPTHPDQLADHKIIGFSGLSPRHDWPMMIDGNKVNTTVRPTLAVNDFLAVVEAVKSGQGIAIAQSYAVADECKAGRLVSILDEFMQIRSPVHLVYPENRLLSAKSRTFMDFAAPRLREWLDARHI